MSWGWAIFMAVGWLALLGLFVAFVLAFVRDRRNPSAREVLDRRLAAGDITLEDYERARAAMSRVSDEHAPAGPPAHA